MGRAEAENWRAACASIVGDIAGYLRVIFGGKKCCLERLVAVMLQIRWVGGMSERAAEVSVPTVAVGYARLNAFALDSSTFPLMF